jgi:hypothetical protein
LIGSTLARTSSGSENDVEAKGEIRKSKVELEDKEARNVEIRCQRADVRDQRSEGAGPTGKGMKAEG